MGIFTEDYDPGIIARWERKLLRWLLSAKIKDGGNPLVILTGEVTHDGARHMAKELKEVNPNSMLVILQEGVTLDTLSDDQLKRIGLKRIES